MYRESTHQASLSERLYQNPVLSGDWPDPAVFREGEDYYLAASTARYYPALTLWHSKNLVDWEPFCNPIPGFSGDVWAPDLLSYQGRYYLYFSASGTNYVTCSERIDSGWCEPVDLRIGHIDPGHCEEDGQRYLMLSGGWMAPLSSDGMRVTGGLRQVITPAPIPEEWDVEGAYPESPKVTRRGGWFYLTYADGGTGGPATAHMVVSARAKSLFGPWEFPPYNPIVHTWSRSEKWHAKGHGHLVEDTAGDWWILYHAYERDYMGLGRSLLLERIEWTGDGWFRLHNTGLCTQPLRKPAGGEFAPVWALSDDFAGEGLKITWKMFGRNEFSRVESGGGRLALRAEGETPGQSAPLLVAAGDHSYVVSAEVEPTKGCEAGLILIYNEQFYTAAGWNGETITLYRQGKKFETVSAVGKRIRMYLRNDRQEVAFYYALEDGRIHKINYVLAVQSMNASAYGGFSSLRPGLFACGTGESFFTGFRYETESRLLTKGTGI